jgi:hypothetical protein
MAAGFTPIEFTRAVAAVHVFLVLIASCRFMVELGKDMGKSAIERQL